MAFTTQTHAGTTFADRWATLRTELGAAHAKRKLYRVTRNELNDLSDRELSDLGLNRTMIKRLALEAAGYV